VYQTEGGREDPRYGRTTKKKKARNRGELGILETVKLWSGGREKGGGYRKLKKSETRARRKQSDVEYA